MGHDPILSNPKQTKAIAAARLKNDRVDAEPLALALDAFYLEHRLCDELESGVEDVAGGTRVWIRCACGAGGGWYLPDMDR